MRVTKAVREYIEKQVRAKVEKKYDWEQTEDKRIRDIKSDIEQRARDAAFIAAKAVYEEAKELTDIFDYQPESLENYFSIHTGRVLELKDFAYVNSVHKWRYRMNNEVEEKVQDIIVTLELGGNKADLDRMLSEL